MADEDKIIVKEVIEIEQNTMYEFTILSWHYGEYTNKGMVFYIKFFGKNGKEINERIYRFSSSRAFTNYMYIATGTKSEPVSQKASFLTPQNSFSMEIGLVNWGYLDSPEGKILLNENPTMKRVNLEIEELSTLIKINDKWIYSANLTIQVPDERIGRVAILGVKYFDSKNKLLRPTKKEHVFWSSDLDTHYRYITSPSGGQIFSMEHVFHPPENAEMLECTVMNWESANCTIAFEGPLKSNLNWQHSDKQGLLGEINEFENKDYTTYSKQAELYANSSKLKQLEMNYESFIHNGDLLSAQDAAIALYSQEHSKANKHRIDHIKSLIKSLDVNWFPSIKSSNEIKGNLDSNKILHLSLIHI